MKKIAFLFILLAVFTACTEEENTPVVDGQELEDNFSVSGVVQNGGNLNIYLETMSSQGKVAISEVKSNENGKFEMLGNIHGFGLYYLRMGETNDKIIPLTLAPNDKLVIKTSVANYTKSPELSGTEYAESLADYITLLSTYREKQSLLSTNPDELSNIELNAEMEKLRIPVDSFAIANMNLDPANSVNLILYPSLIPSKGFQDYPEENITLLNKVAQSLGKKYPENVSTQSMMQTAYQVEMEYRKFITENSGTFPAPEITLKNPQGEELSLSSLKGQVVLIDFWASWCGPCRRENPNVVNMYNKYKDQGFTVFSVSLDEDLDKWRAAIEKDGLSWENHVAVITDPSSTVQQEYGVKSIPHTVLINREGNLIGTQLRGSELEQKLKEVFSK